MEDDTQMPKIEPGRGRLIYDKTRRTIVSSEPMETMTDVQRYYDALKRIARGYQTSDQLRRRAGQYGLDHAEELEMSYENIQQEAELAIKGKRRPTV